jgi:hypothetical protein
MQKSNFVLFLILAFLCFLDIRAIAEDYIVVDTGQDHCYGNFTEIPCPADGHPFCGQDAQYFGHQPSYYDNGDGTVTDLNTGLMWQQTPDLDNKPTYPEAVAGADTCSIGGYHDWRMPAIKELYSLIDFRGHTGMNAETSIPYIDTSCFDFRYGDEDSGERFIDAQYWSGTQYVGLTMNGDTTEFGVNFADGRIKGYPRDNGPSGQPMREFVRYVRGYDGYGVSEFVDNGDGTISDLSTGLIWQKADDGTERNWEEALEYAQNLTLAGQDDWRLPNAKELQSIIDYTRAPDAGDPALVGPAIDSLFEIANIGSEQDPEYGYYWTGTTHLDGPDESYAVYLCFGRGLGWMEQPPGSGHYVLLNVHGAGCQRSDPKSGDPDDFPHGHGPQGDVIRIYNLVRCVRGGLTTDTNDESGNELPGDFRLSQNYPNPFNASTVIQYRIPHTCDVKIDIYDLRGRRVATLIQGEQQAGFHQISWNADIHSSGLYFYRIRAGEYSEVRRMVLLK